MIFDQKVLFKLPNENELLRQLVNMSSDLISVLDLNQNIIFANNAFLTEYGYDEDEIYQESFYKFISAKNIEFDYEEIFLKATFSEWSGEIYSVRKNGSDFIISLTTSIIKDTNDEFIGYLNVAQNLTKLKSIEEDMVNASAQLESVFKTFPDLFFKVDAYGKVLDYISGSIDDLYVPPEEFLGKKITDFMPPKVSQKIYKAISKVLRTNSLVTIEYSLPLKNITRIYEARFSPFLNSQILVIVRDITKNKRAEKAIKKSELQFRTIWESSLDGMRLVDPKGKIIAVNKAFCNLVEMNSSELIGKPFYSVYLDENTTDHEQALNKYRANFRKKNFQAYFEREVSLKTGRKIVIEAVNTIVEFSDEDSPLFENEIYLLSIFRDVTARRNYELELIKLRKAVESSGEVIIVTDENEKITYVNPEFTNLYGYKPFEVLGKTTKNLLGGDLPAPNGSRNFWQFLINKKKITAECVHKSKDGRLINIEVSANPIYNERNQIIGFLSIERDITERKRAREILRESEEKYRMLVETSPDMILLLDLDGNVIMGNDQFVRNFGFNNIMECLGKIFMNMCYLLKYLRLKKAQKNY